MSAIIRTVVAGVLTLGFCACGSDQSKQNTDGIRTVYIAVPQTDISSPLRVFTSSIEEGKSVNAGFKTGGQIRKLSYKEGDKVTKGAVLGLLDDADYRLQLQQLQTQYNQVSAEVGRLEEMFRRNNIAPNDYEKAKAGLEQLKTQLELLERQLSYTRLESPASGYVVERYMEEGEMAGAGTPVYKIMDNSSLETSIALPASIYAKRDEIASCTGKSVATGETEIPLEIINFVPDGDNNALFRLRLGIPSRFRDQLLPGMNMTVSLMFKNDDGGQSTSVIPSRAVFERDGQEYVWVVNRTDSTVSAKPVERTGMHRGGETEVTGLDGSEQIVAAGVHHISDGMQVRVAGNVESIKKEGIHD